MIADSFDRLATETAHDHEKHPWTGVNVPGESG
jgi:hypothetical protein